MRILFLCNYSLLYGANRSMLTLLEGLKKKGYELLVFLPSEGPITTELRRLDIDYKVIRFFSSYMYLKILYKHLLVPILFFYNFLVIPRLLRETARFKPDLIYSNTSAENLGIVIAKILKVKHISHIREFMSLDHGSYFILGRRLKKKFIELSDGVIYVSKAVASHVRILEEPEDNRNCVIFNGIHPPVAPLTRNPVPTTIRLGSVGVLQPSKGHHIAIDFFSRFEKKYPNSELHIFGEGYSSYRKKLLKEIERLNLQHKVILHGFVKNTDEIYSKIDALCMFSRSEGFGRVTAESMLRGVPVIGLNNGGTRELIEDSKSGFLITDYETFERSLNLLFANDEAYNNIRMKAFADAKESFSIEKYVNTVENFILKIANNNE